jgi:hypothetical protein
VRPLSIREATVVYGDASQCEIVRHWVDHSGLAELSRSLRSLVQSLGDQVADEFWRRTLGPIRRTAFALCSTPIPFAHLAATAGMDWDRLHRLVRQSKQLFPDSYEQLDSVVHKLEHLLLENSSPLIGPLETLRQRHSGFSVVLRNPRMNRSVADFFAGSRILQGAKIVSASQLREAHHCPVLVVIGPCGWFPEHVFSAPRASTIHIVSYRWIRDGWKPGPLFLHRSDAASSGSRSHCIGTMPRISDLETGNGLAPEAIQPSDLVPPLPVFAQGGCPHGTSYPDNSDDVVPARLCHLAGNRAVFIAADDGATSLVIDTSEIGRSAVRRVLVDEVEPGLCLLLRTSGGGDFIAPLADRILGAYAAKRRCEQVEWKDRLIQNAVERFGSIGRRDLSSLVCSDLQFQGLSQARQGNVHYWMSPKCIRPRKREDFAAILKFAGLEMRIEELWTAMGEIDRAHRQAGHLIRRMLLQRIAETSLEPLERDGEMSFQLGDQDGGSLSAYQITDVVAQEYEISADRIGVLLDLEAYSGTHDPSGDLANLF